MTSFTTPATGSSNWTLNWKEIAHLADLIRPEVEGLFIDRIIVPERHRFPGGYLKGEWAIRLTGRRNEGVFLFSARTRHPYFHFIPGKGPKAAAHATRSAFDLELSKHLKGQRLTSFETIQRERTLVLWFDQLGLVLNLIPAAPEAILIKRGDGMNTIITRSRTTRMEDGRAYVFPDGLKAPKNPPFRAELVSSLKVFGAALEKSLDLEAFELRSSAANRELRALDKQTVDRLRQTTTALREAESDQDWQRYGDLLKASMHEQPQIEALEPGQKATALGLPKGSTNFRRVRDYETESEILLPADPKLDISQQVEKYYQLARRKARRIEEARSRQNGLEETHRRLSSLLSAPLEPGNWKSLETLERAAFATSGAAGGAPTEGLARNKKAGAWLGKTFVSRDGLTILVGRSKDENLELTFKHSRGNDVWMHVRGRPGAHVLVPLQPGKSAPLETLLDAAVLCIYYSGGEKWGKTEVDYTFKKYVRRIKDSTEASYTNNKTLIVEPEQARLKRLLGS